MSDNKRKKNYLFFLLLGFTPLKALKLLLFSFLCSLIGLWFLILCGALMQGNVRRTVTDEVVQSSKMIASIYAVDDRLKAFKEIFIEHRYFNPPPLKYLGKNSQRNIVAFELKKVHGQKRKLSKNIYAVRFIDVTEETKKTK